MLFHNIYIYIYIYSWFTVLPTRLQPLQYSATIGAWVVDPVSYPTSALAGALMVGATGGQGGLLAAQSGSGAINRCVLGRDCYKARVVI